MARRRLQAKKNGVDLVDAKNYQQAKRQVARIHQRIKNIRKDYMHKITTDMVKSYDVIVLEEFKDD